MFVDLFIRRPVLSIVTALLIVLGGAICIPLLPVAEFPTLQPPNVSIEADYVGASAETIETAVTTPLELAVNGTVGMRYMSSFTSTGHVGINCQGQDWILPFGGFKRSGVGREMGLEGLELYTELQTFGLPLGATPSPGG